MSQHWESRRGRSSSLLGKPIVEAAAAITAVAAVVAFSPGGAAATGAKTVVRHRHETLRGFNGTALTRSDTLTVFGSAVAGGAAVAEVQDGVNAVSEAEALLTPGASSTSKADAAEGSRSGVHGEHCASPAVPAQLTAIVSATAACSTAYSYSASAGTAGATSGASMVTINVNLLGALGLHLPGLPISIPGVGKLPKLPALPKVPVAGQVRVPATAAGALTKSNTPAQAAAPPPLPPQLAALQQVLGKLPKIPSGGISLSDLIKELTAGKASQVLRIVLGASNTSTLTSSGAGTAGAEGGGGEVDLLPGLGTGGAPLLKVLVGQSKVTSVIAAAGRGHSYATDAPSAVSIALSSPLGSKVINLAPGQSQTVLAGTPLASTISAGYGSTSTAPDGTEHATAQSVTLDLLQGVNGGVDLTLASPDAQATPPIAGIITTTVTPGTRTPTKTPGVPGATTTHTGLAWAGAMPYLLGTFLVGLMLIALPKGRRFVLALRRVFH